MAEFDGRLTLCGTSIERRNRGVGVAAEEYSQHTLLFSHTSRLAGLYEESLVARLRRFADGLRPRAHGKTDAGHVARRVGVVGRLAIASLHLEKRSPSKIGRGKSTVSCSRPRDSGRPLGSVGRAGEQFAWPPCHRRKRGQCAG